MPSVKKTLPRFTHVLLLLAGVPAQAEERPDHFKGVPSHTLEEAVSNLSEYNRSLEAVSEQGELGAAELATVHELTYTLENALAKLRTELETLAATLEAVHVASESADPDTVVSKGREYLSTSRKRVP